MWKWEWYKRNMPRQARIDYPGALHHIIGRGIERRSIFKKDKDKVEFLRRKKILLDKCRWSQIFTLDKSCKYL